MSRPVRLAALWFCLSIAGPLAAAEIAVPPGVGTLAAAIASAADGDTLLLGYGSFAGNVVVDKSLTIRPVNRATDAICALTITIRGAGITVTLQGLKLTQNVVLDQAEAVRLLENRWLSGNVIGDLYRTSDGDGSLVIVGNQLSGSLSNISVDGAYIAGNVLTNGSIYTLASAWIVGNELRSENVTYGIRSQGAGSTVRILGNRVKVASISNGTIYGIYADGGLNLIAGNVIEVEDRTPYLYTEYGIQTTGSGYSTVLNNVVRGMATGTTTRQGQALYIGSSSGQVSGNIVVDFIGNSGPFYLGSSFVIAEYNLCFNNSTACPAGTGNLNADPRFLDLVSYQLAADSPAIDAGPPDYTRADLDRTRNDMGANGGPWSIDQYDAQRDPLNYAPYVYPLLTADSTFGGGVLEIQALGVAKLR